jgi:hypothetical protein
MLEDTIRAREAFYEHMNIWVYKNPPLRSVSDPSRPRNINVYTLELDTLTVDIMHQYAHTVRDYLMSEGIKTIYNEGGDRQPGQWVPTMKVSAWDYHWWVDGYHLGALLPGDTLPDRCTIVDTWISLSKDQVVGSWEGSLSYRDQGIRGLVPLLRVTNNNLRAYYQCGTCHYSDQCVKHCGMGRELLSDCSEYIPKR